jgi:hypothetical protein
MIRTKTLIAAAVAGLLAAPMALAQYSSGGTGPTQMDKRSADEQTPPKSDQEKSASGSVSNSDKRADKRAAKNAKKKSRDRVASNANPDTSTRGGTPQSSTSDPNSSASNVSGADVANTPGTPGTSSPSAGR